MTIDFEERARQLGFVRNGFTSAMQLNESTMADYLRSLAREIYEDAARHFDEQAKNVRAHEMFPSFCLNERASSSENAALWLRLRAKDVCDGK